MTEELKQRYPLAVELLKKERFAVMPYRHLSTEVRSLSANVKVKITTSTEIDPTEEAQDQIGHLFADFLNSLNEEPKKTEVSKLVGHTTKELAYKGVFPAPIGTPVHKDEQGYFIEFDLLTGGKITNRYPISGEFAFTSFNPIA